MNNVLVIVPHGDDEVLGFGGAIQHHVMKKDVVTVCFCKGIYDTRSSIQKKQSIEVKKQLNYNNILFLNITTNNFISSNLSFIKKLEKLIFFYKPDILYTTFPYDTHQDHRELFYALKVATRINASFLVKHILCGETISSTNRSINISIPFTPSYYLPMTASQVKTKIKAFKIYKNEIRDYPHSRSAQGIESISRVRGQESGTKYAEAFMCLRKIIS